MLETVDLKASLSKREYDEAQSLLDDRLGVLQRNVRMAGTPVIVVFEGWDAAGKGSAISRLLSPLDPRGYRVHATNAPTEAERMRPPMWRFWNTLPAAGMIAVYDRSWYGQVLLERVDKLVPRKTWLSAYERIRVFERQLTDARTIIVKIFLHISPKEQAKRFKALAKDPAMAWKVTKEDLRRHKQYAEYAAAAEDMLQETSTANAPWTVVPATDRRYTFVAIAETVATALANLQQPIPQTRSQPPAPPKRHGKCLLDRVDLTPSLPREEYDKALPRLQSELRRLEHLAFLHRRAVMIAYEGPDASGKGGNIRRLTRELDPRGYEVITIAAPEGDEKTHHYLWRFWRTVPKAGHITLFDRTWYGRVLVERVESFAQLDEWGRAYAEINEFEHDLVDSGIILVKFWIQVSYEEQLRRFTDREKNPLKTWKITPEDWRNREKWNDYLCAASEMIERTSTPAAPWTIIEGDDKYHARIKALQTVVAAIKKALPSKPAPQCVKK